MDKGLDPKDLLALINTRRRPRVLYMDSYQLDFNSVPVSRNIIIIKGQKVVISVKEETSVRRITTIREFDPEESYEDALDEFIVKETPDVT